MKTHLKGAASKITDIKNEKKTNKQTSEAQLIISLASSSFCNCCVQQWKVLHAASVAHYVKKVAAALSEA